MVLPNNAKGPNGRNPFSLAFGTEAVISIELGVLSTLIANFDKETNSKRWLIDLELLDEAREKVFFRMVAYQYKVARYFNSKIRNKTFSGGDLVLHRAKFS